MLFAKLIFLAFLLTQVGYVQAKKPEGVLVIKETSFNPDFIQIGPKPNLVSVTAELAGGLPKHKPNVLLLQKIRTLPNGKSSETTVAVLHDNGKGRDKIAGDGIYAGMATIQQKTSGEIKFRIKAENRGVKLLSDVFTKLAGSTFKPNQGGSVTGDDGIVVTVPPDAIPYEARLTIVSSASGDIEAPIGDTIPLMDTVKLLLEPVQAEIEVTPLQKPLSLSFPVPANPQTENFILAKEIEVPLPGMGEDEGGFFKRLMPVDTAVVDFKSNRIVTDGSFYDGVFGSGLYALLADFGSDNISGSVCEGTQQLTPCPATAVKVPSVVVASNTNSLVAVSNSQGIFQLYISGTGPYTLTAFDSMRGFSGEAAYSLPNQVQQTDIVLSKTYAFSKFKSALAGIRNGGFECVKEVNDPVTGAVQNTFCEGFWETKGDVAIVQSVPLCSVPAAGDFDPGLPCPAPNSPSEGNILPSEGKWMARITTGVTNVGDLGSVLTQRFTVPAGSKTLYVDYIFLSEEFNEFAGTQFDDTFNATVTTSDGVQKFIKTVGVDNPGVEGLQPCTNIYGQSANCLPEVAMFNCGFPGGDATCGKIPFVVGDRAGTIRKWATAAFDMSEFAGKTVTLDLAFTAVDKGDNNYNTKVLLDNIRFNTAFVDVKAVRGVFAGDDNAQLAAVTDRFLKELHSFGENNLRRYGANEILSQAGLNIQLRGVRLIDNLVANVNKQDIDAKSILLNNLPYRTSEIKNILNNPTNRSADAKDVNLYYVGELLNQGRPAALTVSPEDYRGDFNVANLLSESGILLAEDTDCPKPRGVVLAHELGHLFMRDNAALEHATANSFTAVPPACAGGGNDAAVLPFVTGGVPGGQQLKINLNDNLHNPFLTE
ncbi:hypothetical protein NP590_13455 [Methylomonas sp. SURF-2]|uniref:Peptidase M12B domain-containing protein n=1 Tax=Methylomonas subterranea TaxID=2952225 RepID=A0ABT1TI26_9GAMM|nr:hypothetical protein [Methylomonas sp. SURF-2]MCQ8105116.1 hypothetical protein [Methylomonas sp. SURF-2]